MCNYLNIYNFETCLDDKIRKKAANGENGQAADHRVLQLRKHVKQSVTV